MKKLKQNVFIVNGGVVIIQVPWGKMLFMFLIECDNSVFSASMSIICTVENNFLNLIFIILLRF